MRLNKDTIIKIMGLIAFAVFLFLGLQNMDLVYKFLMVILGLAMPFIVGVCIAFILNVPMSSLERSIFESPSMRKFLVSPTGRRLAPLIKKLRRPASIVLTFLAVLGVVFVVVFLIAPELGRTFLIVRDTIPVYLTKFQDWTTDLSKQYPEIGAWIQDFNFDWVQILQSTVGFLTSGAGSFLNSTFNMVASVFSGLFTFFLGLIFSVYMLMQKEKLGRQIRSILYAFFPVPAADRILAVTALTSRTFTKFLSGQVLEALILGFMFFVAMTIFRFPYTLMISVLIAFTALIPIFGAFIGCVVGAFLILMVDPVQAFWFVILFLILQQIEGNLIYPRVVGSSVGLPSIWVLVAVTIGGSTMGVMGMLIFIPICSVLYVLLREAVHYHLRKKKVPPRKVESPSGYSDETY